MRLRRSTDVLERLQQKLRRAGHAPDDPFYRARMAAFWQQLYFDKRIAKGEV